MSIDALGSPEACRTGILSLGPARAARAGGAAAPGRRARSTCRWSGSSAGSSTCSAATAWRPPTTPALLDDVVSRRLDLGDLLAPGEPFGLAAAGRALVAMGSTPSRGIVLVDPSTLSQPPRRHTGAMAGAALVGPSRWCRASSTAG